MERIWLRNYPPGVPHEIDPDAYRSVAAVLDDAFARYAALPAFTNLGTVLSYARVEELSRRFAAFLQGLGARPGDRIALMMPNLLQYPVTLFGALRAGLTVVNVNPLYTPRELHHQLVDSGAEILLVLENQAHVASEALEGTRVRHVLITAVGDLLPAPKRQLTNFVVRHVRRMVKPYRFARAISLRRALRTPASRFAAPRIGPRDPCLLQYTGGTTGVSKGAVLTHRNLVANILQVATWFTGVLLPGKEIIVTPLPLYHIFSLSVNCLSFLTLGGLNLLITNPRDLDAFVAELARWPFTTFMGVNTLFNALLQHPRFVRLDFSHLKLSVGGGMAVQESVARRWEALTGCHILEGYGLTETSPVVTINPPHLRRYTGSVGLPISSTEVEIRDEEGRALGLDEPGELCVRGPQVMAGYWNRPEETRQVLSEDGWLRTGDIARIDAEGFVYIVDRKKDMILVSGFNVYPNEVEEVLVMHPAVAEAACIGVPDPRTGEAVRAFVVLRPGAETTPAELIEHCRHNLTPYKVPRVIEFRTELPKTPVGKILRRKLREEYVAQG
ncbi:MAG TPA: long-chain-fatty-acid--CoA ligase [Chromatiales bacterium]|nr:long-chain-fatty-acid--CoA ligase [Chromatiales bacterium]